MTGIQRHGHSCDGGHGSDIRDFVKCDASLPVENALVLSKKGVLRFKNNVPADFAVSVIAEKITDIAKLLAVGNDILGHIKALIDCDAGKTTLSVTRVDSPDLTRHDNWDGEKELLHCVITVNILSLANTDIKIDDAVARVFKY